MDLNDYRKEIDRIDDQLIALFAQRMETAEKIAEYKKANGLRVLDARREREKMREILDKTPAALREYVTKDTVLGTAQFPIKTYTARIRLDDGSYVDLAAHGRTDEPGVIGVYYHTRAEYATDYNLIIQNLLEGYDPGT